ncbi:MAG: oligosaccharide flippase family protein [Bacteroidia bacterium]|nr:oligosaccharide flippase family protein [Bacteroidia bacterium]
MQKKFITNIAFLVFVNILVKPFWILGIDRAVQNAVGTEHYGFYASLFNFSLLFNIFLDLGITNYNSRNISQNMQLVQKHFSGIVALRLLLAGLYLLIGLVTAFIIGYQAYQFQLLIILFFNQILLSFIMYFRSNISGLHLFKTDSIISVIDRLIMILICGFLLIFFPQEFSSHLEWFALSQTAGYLITAAITLWILHGKVTLQRITFHWPFLITILKKSAPFAILIFLMGFYNRIDAVMIERLLPNNGAEQSGIYAQAYRLLDAANMIAFLFGGLLLPIFASQLKNKISVEPLTKLSYCLISVPAVILICCCMFYKTQIMDLLYESHHNESAQVLGVLVFCFFAMSSNYIFGTLLTANGNLKQMNIMALCGMCINIGLNLILIPKYFAFGAACSSLVTQFATAIIQIGLSHKVFGFKLDSKLLALFALYAVLVMAVSYLTSQLISNWLVGILLTSTIALGLAFLLKLINLKHIALIMKQEE